MMRELDAAQKQQHFLATHDTLTQLPNRYAFLSALRTALADASRGDQQLAIMFFDLDGFKSINDNLGHAAGDELLIDVAKRLRLLIRKSDLIARLGGDEFVAAIRNVRDPHVPMLVAKQILDSIEGPVARIVGVIVIIITGLSLAFGDAGGGFRKLIQIVFGLSIAFAATSFFLSFFSFGGGAVVL